MAVPNPEIPRRNAPLVAGGLAGSRPVAVPDAGGNAPGGLGAISNRPIPIKPRSDNDLPESDDEPAEDDDDFREVIKNAPAWLVSTVFHMLLLIVLGLLVVGSRAPRAELDVEVGYAEDLGRQLENAAELASDNKLEDLANDPIVTPQDLPPVDDPLVTPPVIEDLKVSSSPTTVAVTGSTQPAPSLGLALSGRQAGSKQALLEKYGGTKGTEAAVELGLEWLAKQQRRDGSWSLSGPYPDGSRSENTAAATAMALLAFQGHGDTHREGKYKKVVKQGWNALLKMQRKSGSFNGGQMTEPIQQLYTHAQATIAICELYGMTGDSQYRAPAERAVAYAVESQDMKNGGWRYTPGQDSDTSVTGWFMMALESARMAKLSVPNETLERISMYLDAAAVKGGRQYGYWRSSDVRPAMCAEGLLCRQYLGWTRDDPRLVEGAEALLKIPVSYDLGAEVDVYYWYYATQVAHHMEGNIWHEWNEVMRREVPEHQVKSGPQAGSWDPQTDRWGNAGGRLYVTCLSIYNLEVYYRHLPLYAGYQALQAFPAVKSGEAAEGENKTPPDAPEKDGAKDAADEAAGKDAARSNAPETAGGDKP